MTTLGMGSFEEKAIDTVLKNLFDSCRENNIDPHDKRLRMEIHKEYDEKTHSFHMVGSYRPETEDEKMQRLINGGERDEN